MINNANDIKYFKKYVNRGNRDLADIKSSTLALFIIGSVLGILFTLPFGFNSAALRLVCLAIMIGGIVSVISADKWFSGNRGHLFLAGLRFFGFGFPFLAVGLFMAFNISIQFIIIFIAAHVVAAVLILNIIIKRITERRLPKDSAMKKSNYLIGGASGAVGVSISNIIEGFNKETQNMIMAVLTLFLSIALWVGVQKLFQLYYAVKYNIDVVNTWDHQRDSSRMNEENQCLLFGKTIEESLCIKINYEK